MIAVLILAHVVICAASVILIYNLREYDFRYMIPALVFVPVFGYMLWFMNWGMERKRNVSLKDVDVDCLHIEDIKYQPLHVDEESDITAVPFEEAMAFNESDVKRKLLMDILNKSPENHIELLQKARMGNDTEITHYAITTMAEIQGSYEKKIEELGKEVLDNPKDEKVLNHYRRELKGYINSGLITGNILAVYRKQLEAVLKDLIELDDSKFHIWKDRIENQINMKVYDQVEAELELISQKWPDDERVYFLKVKYYWTISDGKRIRDTLKEVDDKKIYLSSKGMKWFTFWSHKE